jgi:hypothetical protein
VPVVVVGTVAISSGSAGTILVSDVPTIAYDATSDITLVASNAAGSNAGPGIIHVTTGASLDLGLSDAPSLNIASTLGGSGTLQVDESSTSALRGTLVPTALKVRQGYPALSSVGLAFDLKKTPTTIQGTITSTELILGDTKLLFNAAYDLYLDNGLWRGKMTGKLDGSASQAQTFTYDYDTPILTQMEALALDTNAQPTTGGLTGGGTVRVRLRVNSNAPVNWIDSSWDSPVTNLEGGGNGAVPKKYGTCPTVEFSQGARTPCEHSPGYWTWYRDYQISPHQPSGTYSWTMSVKNAAELSSRTAKASLAVTNAAASTTKPTITTAQLAVDAGLGSGSGGTVKLQVLAQSATTINWLNKTLDGPTTNIEGGGGGATFSQCPTLTMSPPALCSGKGNDYWYHAETRTFTQYSENGTYIFHGLSVQTDSNITSDAYSTSLKFSLAGNTPANTPTITSGRIVRYVSGNDPASTGVDITGTCLVAAAVSDPLWIALIVNATSNVPVDWINMTLNGPTANLIGGGGGTSATDLGGGTWQVVYPYSLASPSFAPKGSYSFASFSVQNAGNKTSVASGPLSFNLKTSCP